MPAADGPIGPEEVLGVGRRVLEIEASAVRALVDRLGNSFVAAVELVAGCEGRVVTCGLGKSGIVARKLAATLTSTGTPAHFLHPVEGLHGDLGIVGASDIAVVVSKSGTTEDFAPLLQFLGRMGVKVIAIASTQGSALEETADVTLDCSVAEEACPLDLAPTASTTAALAMADALAVAVLERRGFTEEEFARLHPGGHLGRRLTLRVEDVMGTGDDVPTTPPDALVRDVIGPMASKRGTVAVVDADGALRGVVTSGDLTRLMERTEDFLPTPVGEIMSAAPKTASPNELGSAAAHRMEQHGIMALPVVDANNRVLGMVHLHDLMRSGAV